MIRLSSLGLLQREAGITLPWEAGAAAAARQAALACHWQMVAPAVLLTGRFQIKVTSCERRTLIHSGTQAQQPDEACFSNGAFFSNILITASGG